MPDQSEQKASGQDPKGLDIETDQRGDTDESGVKGDIRKTGSRRVSGPTDPSGNTGNPRPGYDGDNGGNSKYYKNEWQK